MQYVWGNRKGKEQKRKNDTFVLAHKSKEIIKTERHLNELLGPPTPVLAAPSLLRPAPKPHTENIGGTYSIHRGHSTQHTYIGVEIQGR